MPYEPYEGVYQYLDEQIGFRQQTTGHRAKKPLPRRDIISAAQAQRQAEIEVRARQRNFQGTTRMTPDALPRVRQRPDAQADDDLYTRAPRSAVRYQPEKIYEAGNTRLYAGQVVIPKKGRSAQPQLSPAHQHQHERYTDGIDEQGPERTRGYCRRVPLPWYVLLSIGAVLALTLWIGGAWVNTWWITTQNDWTYTQAFRTFSIDMVVGHNHDSRLHPSHFIVQNDKRHIIIIELPADDWSKSVIYSAPTLIGDGQEKTPATISFQVDAQTGRLDMVLHVEDQTYLFPNNGTKFVSPQGQ
jgi:hypothetical protein